ncbi:MAG: hypothetical protein Q8O46_05340 [bacterium]|nr:hypothetical protein [bacterium]
MISTILNNTNIFSQMSLRIIKEQELIVGPLAWEEAKKVPGIQMVDPQKGSINIEYDPKNTIDKLVAQYERLFGRASHEVCREAVQEITSKMSPEDVPSSLK